MFLRLYYSCLCSIRRFMMTFSTPWVTQDRTTTLRSSYSHLHCLLCQPKGTHSPMWRLGMPASLKGYILPLIQPFSSRGRITSTSPFPETPHSPTFPTPHDSCVQRETKKNGLRKSKPDNHKSLMKRWFCGRSSWPSAKANLLDFHNCNSHVQDYKKTGGLSHYLGLLLFLFLHIVQC